MLKNNIKLKLTEKEINTISYLSKSENPVSIDELQEKVWSYQSDIETHTVETHIYRLRKKILNTFNDKDFIISEKKWLSNQVRRTLWLKIYLPKSTNQK